MCHLTVRCKFSNNKLYIYNSIRTMGIVLFITELIQTIFLLYYSDYPQKSSNTLLLALPLDLRINSVTLDISFTNYQ